MRFLHLIRDPGEEFGLELARQQAGTEEVTVVLLREGGDVAAAPGVRTFALVEDVPPEGAHRGVQPIDAAGLIRLVETHDRVFVW
jgi:hypothetical protein